MQKKSIILDLDIFGDVDDFFALIYALSNPQIEMGLIVTADEHKAQRAQQLRFIFQRNNIGIPVVAGVDLGNTRLLFVDDHTDTKVDTDYLEKVRQLVSESEKVHYFCLAPQTNLVHFAKAFPELAQKMNIVIMGGSLYTDLGRVEHNLRYDIQSAQYTLNQLNANWVLADQTNSDKLAFQRADEFYKKILHIGTPLSTSLLESAHRFFDALYPISKFHDPLALSVLLHDFVKFEQKKVIIDETGQMKESTDGIWTNVSVGADYDSFLQHFKTSVLGYLSATKN